MKRILIVDDVAGWIRFHQTNIQYLNLNDIEIDTANCARQGVEKVEANIDNPYDIILTDLQMESDFLPKTAGEWFIEQIKTYSKYYKETKIFIISASPIIDKIAEKHNVSYIPKTVARNSGAEIYRSILFDNV
jgi:CheY-like chemotaxis protein